MTALFKRAIVDDIHSSLLQWELIQLMVGPRQVGKTTAALMVRDLWSGAAHYASADAMQQFSGEWIRAQWAFARSRMSDERPSLLILDEVQKISGWSEYVKALWDDDRVNNRSPLKVLLLGSSALLLSRGTTESLAGRFMQHRCLHWSFAECEEAFQYSLEDWLFFGGYPGAAALRSDEEVWHRYISDSLVETAIGRDVLSVENITKPALLRHLFGLCVDSVSRILSYNKMLGQLRDAGNTTTLANYLQLLERAFLVSGLQLYAKGSVRKKASSPKLILWNNALATGPSTLSFNNLIVDPATRGRLVENAVGAHLLNHLQGFPYEIYYWREHNEEVDFVVSTSGRTFAIEVKSGKPGSTSGLAAFCNRFPRATPLIVGMSGIPLEDFFREDPKSLLSD